MSMMMKHRIFLLLLVLSLMCGLCACTAAPTDTGASAQTDELHGNNHSVYR